MHIRGKTGSAEVYGKQSTSWVATYDENYVVVMMVSQGGTGSGTSGPAVRAIWEALYGVDGMACDPAGAAIPGTTPPEPAADVRRRRLDPAAARARKEWPLGLARRPALDWVLMRRRAVLLVALAALLVWSATAHRVDLTGGDSTAYLRKQLVNIVDRAGAARSASRSTDHRWVRILAPLVYLRRSAGLVLVLTMGSTINGSRSWLQLGGLSVQPSELAKLAVVIGMALVLAERASRPLAPTGSARSRCC